MFKHSLLSVRRLLIGINDTQKHFLFECRSTLHYSHQIRNVSFVNQWNEHCNAIYVYIHRTESSNALGRVSRGAFKITTTRPTSLTIPSDFTWSLDENVVYIILITLRQWKKENDVFVSFYDIESWKNMNISKTENHLTPKVLYRILELWW